MINEEIKTKLSVLVKIAHLLNSNNITYAIGASLLLYFKGKTDTFHDIDIMVIDSDANKVKELLKSIDRLEAPNPNVKYKTKCFLEFNIDGVEVDIMSGFIIVKDGIDYDCSLKKEDIKDFINIDNELIPLDSLTRWRKFYELMDRPNKVKMIDSLSK
jgi:hypothetical protein